MLPIQEEEQQEQQELENYEDYEDADDEEEDEEEPEVARRTLVQLYVALLLLRPRLFRRGSYLVIGVWLFLCAFGAGYGWRFVGYTRASFNPPAHSLSAIAEAAFRNQFPYEAARAAATMVVINSRGKDTGSIVEDSGVREFDNKLRAVCLETYGTNVVYVSYFTLTKGGLAPLAKETLDSSENPQAMLISLTLTNEGHLVTSDSAFVTWLDGVVHDLSEECLDQAMYEARVTGVLAFFRDVNEGTEKDLMAIDLISFPSALVILAGMLKSFRLLLIPILNIIVTISVSFLIMWPIAVHSEVVTYAPSIMGSTSLALSIDFSLFLLARYRHELPFSTIRSRQSTVVSVTQQRNNAQREAVEIMLTTSGHTIIVSGLTLAACWFALCGFPVVFLSTIGVAAGVTSVISLVVNVTLTPAMLLAFPRFFTNLDENFHGVVAALCCCRCFGLQRPPPHDLSFSFEGNLSVSAIEAQENNSIQIPFIGGNLAAKSAKETSPLWYRFARTMLKSEKRACIVIIFILILCIPFSIFAVDTSHSNSFLLSLPREKEATKAYTYLNKHFGAGRMSPYHLLIRPPLGVEILSDEFWSYISDEVIEKTILPLSTHSLKRSGVLAPMFIDGQAVPFSGKDKFSAEYCLLKEKEKDYPFEEQCASLKVVSARQASRNQDPNTGDWVFTSIYIQIELHVEPESQEGADWVRKARKALLELAGRDKYQFYLAGGDVVMQDIVDSVYEAFPRAIGVTMLIVFSFIGIAFRSIVVPIRSVVTIALTITIIWGTSSLVFEHGILDPLGIPPFTTTNGGDISWVAPVISFSVAVGLSLDYDCYLLTKILESGENGLSEQESVIEGLASSGSIITAAGIIMMVAWSGLLLSSQPVLNQIGMFLVCAVLMDCLVIRTVLVPCIMFLLATHNLNWFPRGKWKGCFRRLCCMKKPQPRS